MKTASILILVLLLTSCWQQKQNNDLDFASDLWKTANKRVRGRMSPDLEKRRVVIDKTPEEIEKLLGNANIKDGDHWIYLITIDDDFFGYDYYFNINFDKKTGRVRSGYIGD